MNLPLAANSFWQEPSVHYWLNTVGDALGAVLGVAIFLALIGGTVWFLFEAYDPPRRCRVKRGRRLP
jgi:hypothetical protein